MSDDKIMAYTPMDLDALDEQERAIGFGQGSGNFYQFKDGRNVVRVLPGVYGQQPFVNFWKHFVRGTGDKRLVSLACALKMAKQPCAVCRVAAKLSRGTDADRDVAGDLNARGRTVCNLIDRAAPDAGPQVAEFGTSVYGQMKDYARISGHDFSAVADGADFFVEKRGAGLKTEYKVVAARKASPLHEDARQVAEWMGQATDLRTYVMVLPEHEQVTRLSETLLGPLLGERQASPRSGGGVRVASASPKQAMAYDDTDDGNY